MSGKRYTDEFKIEAVKQVLEQGHSVASVAKRLGITIRSLHTWKKTFGQPEVVRRTLTDHDAEVRKLRAEVKRLTEERDILKKAAAYFAKG
jgi:transposase